MAYFRCGGGGIPASLKSGMNDVLNKKFGTSTTYPPADWPDTVNLMGPLPEKTASGAIASFADGADDVPIKSLVCNIDANLSGVSSVGVVHSGLNWLNESNAEIGTEWNGSSASNRARLVIPCTPSTQYTLSMNGTNNISNIYRKWTSSVPATDAGSEITNSFPVTFTTGADSKYIVIAFSKTSITQEDVNALKLQLELGSTAHTYESFHGESIPVSWQDEAGTIYGGSVDVVNGTGTKTHVRIDMGSLSWTYHAASGVYSDYFDCYLPNDSILGIAAVAFDGVTDDYVSIPSNNIAKGTYTNGVMALANASRRFIICDTRYTSEAALTTALQGKYLSYPLETHEDFTFTPTPINSYLGDNNIWCDSGDTEVTYRADINLALNQ